MFGFQGDIKCIIKLETNKKLFVTDENRNTLENKEGARHVKI